MKMEIESITERGIEYRHRSAPARGRPRKHTKLYWTDALPDHYIALKPDGSRWLIACAPMAPEVWQNARPYKGNYTLERVCPTAIERFYQPQE